MKIMFFSHTHWDREWYHPFQIFRYKLVKVVDNVISLLKKNEYNYFTLDGQSMILEDYFNIRPDLLELKELIESGKLIIGPWYILPDEFLVSGESLIRNLFFAARIVKIFEKSSNVGYLPDMFGHIAQMPQILKGFGMESALVWRGVNPSKSLFTWVAPDQSSVMTIYLPLGYYNTSLIKPVDNFQELKDQIKKLKKYSPVDYLLLPNGGDHLKPVDNLKEIIKAANEQIKPDELTEGTLEAYVYIVKDEHPELEKIEGELRNSENAYILPGVLSSRNYLKLYNQKISMLLERWAEPLGTYSWVLGWEYPENLMRIVWAHLLQNQPHDSICGCSIDPVHAEMVTRYESALQLVNELIKGSMRSIVPNHVQNKNYLFVFNMSPYKYSGVMEAELNFHWMKKFIDFNIWDAKKSVKYEILSRNKEKKFYSDIDVLPEWREVQTDKILIKVKDIPAFGYKAYKIEPLSSNEKQPVYEIQSKSSIENEYFHIGVMDNGSLKIVDKVSERTYNNVNLLEDSGDAGDEYNYSPPLNDSSIYPELLKVSVEKTPELFRSLKIELMMNLPSGVTSNRKSRIAKTVKCPIEITVSLYKGSSVINIQTRVKNLARDHRLRVLFPFIKSKDVQCNADSQFCVLDRPVTMESTPIDVPKGKERVENTFPIQSFVNLYSPKKECGLTVITKGLYEAEIVDFKKTPSMAVTLLRCVGWLSRDDLRTRGGGAGPAMETPGAQCIGDYTFEYCLIPHNNLSPLEIARQAYINTSGVKYLQLSDLDKSDYPDVNLVKFVNYKLTSLFTISPPDIIQSSLKSAEVKDGVILRFYNPTKDILKCKIKPHFEVTDCFLCNLKEDNLQAIRYKNGIDIELGPYKVVTLKFSVK